jgi:hypothetical protein
MFFFYINERQNEHITNKYHEFFENNQSLLNSCLKPSEFYAEALSCVPDRYDCVTLTNSPNNHKLIGNVHTDQGHQLPLNAQSNAPLDGEPMAIFANNVCSPDCCPSTYTCDRGCVCTTEQQRKLINGRGNNRCNA